LSYHLPPYRVRFPLSAQSIKEVDWGLAANRIPEVWKRTEGDGVRIAVIDSGCAIHYALRGVAGRENFSTDETELDQIGHGTHVTGIICGTEPPAKGIAPKATVHSLKVLSTDGQCQAEHVSRALDRACELDVDLVCMSLGSSRPNGDLHASIQKASRQGVTLVAAAGNDGGSVNYPAAFPETIAVGAVDRHNEICPFSCRGPEIVCAAPGEDIQSTWLAGGYAIVSGTSMAAPFVVGLLALYISTLGRKATPSELLSAISATAADQGEPGRDADYGWGLIDIHKLIDYQAMNVEGTTVYIPKEKQ